MASKKGVTRFTEEERKVRVALMERGMKQKDLSAALGIAPSDICDVVCQRSLSPRYIEAVYTYLGLDLPEESGAS